MTVPEITVKSEFDGLMAEAATNIEDMISVNIDDSEPDDRMTQASVMPVARAMKPVVAKADAFLLDDLESAECESDDCIRTQPGMAGPQEEHPHGDSRGRGLGRQGDRPALDLTARVRFNTTTPPHPTRGPHP